MQFVGGGFTLKKNGPELVAACKADDVEAAKQCLERCPYAIHFKDAEGLTPLHVAAAHDSKKCVVALVDHAPAVPARTPCGDTALHTAARHGAPQASAMLIASHDFALDAPNTWDEAPLHLAASSGSMETVKYFVGAGADKTLRDHMKRTPYNVAEDLGFDEELLSLLRVEDDEEPVTSRVEPSAAPAPPPPPERAVPTKPPPAGAAANVVRDRRKTNNIDAAKKALEEALAL